MEWSADPKPSREVIESECIDVGLAWSLLLAIRRVTQRGSLPPEISLGCTTDGAVALHGREHPRAVLTLEADGRWRAHRAIDGEAEAMIELCLPMALAGPGRPLVLGHLGVSLDGCVATDRGESQYITGPENIVHLHRLRALADAVIVGATTVELDDPRLTTRKVEGGNPVRVVIDPARRLRPEKTIFTDRAASTLIFCAENRADDGDGWHGSARVLGIPAGPDGLSLDALLARLRALGLHAVLVEGGGFTVSRFLGENRLDRLQLAVAPLLMGAGRPGLRLPPVGKLAQAIRPRCRHFPMGADVLFDCDLRAGRC